jgi:hypothetical protein
MPKKIENTEVKALLSALDDLIDMKILFRKVVPNYTLGEESNQKFLSYLKSLSFKLQPLFSKYLDQDLVIGDKQSNGKEFLEQIKEKKSFLLVSASSSKKILKKLGVDPQNIIVSGGPLIFEDFKKVNPNLSAEVLSGVKKKCNHLLKLLQSNKLRDINLIFIYELHNLTDKIIINELNTNINLMGMRVQLYRILSWKLFEKQSGV